MELVNLLNTGFGLLLSLLIEIVPPFAKWWDTVDDLNKRAYRAWAGLALALLLSLYLHLTGEVPADFSTVAAALRYLTTILTAWIGFVFAGETFYQSTERLLPRKR